MRVLAKFPYNAETVQEYLSDHFYTPPKMHFERNHNLIPEIDPEEYELELCPGGRNDENPITLSFDDIKKMPEYTLVAYLCCAGNKRKYLQDVHGTDVKGLKWNATAIANSKWKGVSIRYILLEQMKLKEEDLKCKHLIAYGYDADF